MLIFGLMTRLAALPLMFGMLMAFFVIHGADPFAVRELPLLYLGVYVFLLWGGAGTGRLLDKCRNIGSPEFFVFDDKRTGKKPVKQ